MKITNVIMIVVFIMCCSILSCTRQNDHGNVSLEKAVSIASDKAKSIGLNIKDMDSEVLFVGNSSSKHEKGPIRLQLAIRFFPDKTYTILNNMDYYLVFFYRKGMLEHPGQVGGPEYYVFIDSKTGNIIHHVQLGS